jgi:hypothetical protein
LILRNYTKLLVEKLSKCPNRSATYEAAKNASRQRGTDSTRHRQSVKRRFVDQPRKSTSCQKMSISESKLPVDNWSAFTIVYVITGMNSITASVKGISGPFSTNTTQILPHLARNHYLEL